jgi:hypothetical protein
MKYGLELRENLSCATADFADSFGINVMFFQHGADLPSLPWGVLGVPSRIIGLVRSV